MSYCMICRSNVHDNFRCKGRVRSEHMGVPIDTQCVRSVCPETPHGSMDVCSAECYASRFVPGVTPAQFCINCGSIYHLIGDCNRLDLGADRTGAEPEPENMGLRYNEGKSRPDLIPGEVLQALAEHYRYGSNKYADHNWVKGFDYSSCLASLERHLLSFKAGEAIDAESTHHHMIAVMWNAATLLYFELHPEQYAHLNDLLGFNRDKFGPPPRVNNSIQVSPDKPIIKPSVEIAEGTQGQYIQPKIPDGFYKLGQDDTIKENDWWFSHFTLEWEPAPKNFYDVMRQSKGPIIAIRPYHSTSIKIPATEGQNERDKTEGNT